MPQLAQVHPRRFPRRYHPRRDSKYIIAGCQTGPLQVAQSKRSGSGVPHVTEGDTAGAFPIQPQDVRSSGRILVNITPGGIHHDGAPSKCQQREASPPPSRRKAHTRFAACVRGPGAEFAVWRSQAGKRNWTEGVEGRELHAVPCDWAGCFTLCSKDVYWLEEEVGLRLGEAY